MAKQWRARLICAIVFVAAAVMLPVFAQDDPGLPMAGVSEGRLQIYHPAASPTLVADVDAEQIFSITWSDTGVYLAYSWNDPQRNQLKLMVTDGSHEPAELASGLAYGYPVSSVPGSADFLYALSTGEYQKLPNGADAETIHVSRIAPTGGAIPAQIATITMGVGCGGGSPYPADWAYWEETGFGGNALVLALTPYGLVHSTECGGWGTALTDLTTGQSVMLTPGDLHRVVLSPDGTQLAGISSDQVYIVDLATLESAALPNTANPDQLAWANNGDLFYSSREIVGTIPLSAEANAKFAAVFGSAPDIETRRVTLHRLSADDDTQLYGADNWAIGRIIPQPGGSNDLLFSQIPNLHAWVQGITDDTLDIVQDSSAAQRATVPTGLYRLDLSTNTVEKIATGISRVTLDASMFRP